MTKKYLSLLFIAVLALTVAGCRNSKQSKLVGTWKYIPTTEPVDTQSLYLTFYAGDALELEFTGYPKFDGLYSYVYDVESNKINIYANDSLPSYYQSKFVGQYRIETLNKDFCQIVRIDDFAGYTEGAAWLWVDLVKQ